MFENTSFRKMEVWVSVCYQCEEHNIENALCKGPIILKSANKCFMNK